MCITVQQNLDMHTDFDCLLPCCTEIGCFVSMQGNLYYRQQLDRRCSQGAQDHLEELGQVGLISNRSQH